MYSTKTPTPLFEYQLTPEGITFPARNGAGLFKWSDVYAIFICADHESPMDCEERYSSHYLLVTLKDLRVLRLEATAVRQTVGNLYEAFPYELMDRELVERDVITPWPWLGYSGAYFHLYLDAEHHAAVEKSLYPESSNDSSSPHGWDDDYDVMP